jgi:hypothetical protein
MMFTGLNWLLSICSFLQLLRRDKELYGMLMKPRRPRAVVLCPTRELSEQVLDILYDTDLKILALRRS